MKILTLSLFLFLSFSSIVQAQSQASQQVSNRQTFYQIIRAADFAEHVDINIGRANVMTATTTGSNILIEVDVAINDGSSAMLRYLGESGRYELAAKLDKETGRIHLIRAGGKDLVMVKGTACQEFLSYRIYLPESIRYMDGKMVNLQP